MAELSCATSSTPAETPAKVFHRLKSNRGKSYRRHQRNIAQDIKKQQERTSCILPQTSFSRIVHEIVSEVGNGDYYVRQDAVKALQTVSEDMISDMFRETNRLASYTGRETISVADMYYVNKGQHAQMSDDDDDATEARAPLPYEHGL